MDAGGRGLNVKTLRVVGGRAVVDVEIEQLIYVGDRNITVVTGGIVLCYSCSITPALLYLFNIGHLREGFKKT